MTQGAGGIQRHGAAGGGWGGGVCDLCGVSRKFVRGAAHCALRAARCVTEVNDCSLIWVGVGDAGR